jgi:hypothetical protein
MYYKVFLKNLGFIDYIVSGYISKAGHGVIVYHPFLNSNKL